MDCILCGSTEADRLSDALRQEVGQDYTMRPYKCRSCELVFLYPLITEAEQEAFYRHAYRALYHGDEYDKKTFHVQRMPDAVRRKEELIASGLLHGKLLDIGSSTGAFLEQSQQHVELAIGVEPDEEQRGFAISRGFTTYGSLDDLPVTDVDLIVAFHVLEHVRDPVGFLQRAASFLGENGTIVVEVPNVSDVLLTVYRIPEFHRFYWHPAHLYYFSKTTLRMVAEKAGLTGLVIGVQRYPLSNHLNWAIRREPGGQTAFERLFSSETESSYAEDLSRKGLTDTLWMVASKSRVSE